MSDYKYKRGMWSPTEVPGRNRKQFDSAISYLSKPEIGKPVVLRPAGGVCTLGVHKIRFTKDDGSQSGFKVLCPDWDIENQEQGTKRLCPVCRDFGAYGVPKEVRIPLVFSYLFHAFNVTAMKKDKEVHFGMVEANVMNWPEVLEVTQLNGGVDLFDPKNGCCVNWTARQSKFAPGQNEFHFTQGGAHPIAWKEDAWKIKIDGVVYSGEEQDIMSLLLDPDPDDIASSLERTGLYKRLSAATGKKYTTAFVPPQDLDVGDDFEDDAPSAPVAPAKGKTAKTGAAAKADLDDPDLDDADDDFEDDAPAAPPAKAPKKTAAKAPAKPAKDDLDDEFEDDDDADEPEPPKAPAKKAPAKTPAKQEAADEDEWEDDDDDKPDPAKAKPIPAKKSAAEADDDDWD